MVARLSYTVETGQKAPGGPFLGYASAPCDNKGCETKLHIWLGKSNNPEDVQLKARRQGWYFDAWARGRNFCPSCVKARKERARGESGKKPPTLMRPEIDTSNITESARLVISDPPINTETSLNATIKPATGADQGSPRALTVDERLAVRNLLDHKFDDKAGRYTDGYSDQRIGQEVRVPWASVKAMREIAYGELKGNDELDAVKQVLATVESKLAAAKRILDTAKTGADAAKDVMDKALARVDEAAETMASVESAMDAARRQFSSIAAKLGIAP